MTHTHHRMGSEKSLACDYVVLAITARDFNDKGATPKLQRILDTYLRHGAVNAGDVRQGSLMFARLNAARIRERIADTSVIHGAFASLDQVKGVVKDLKEADEGISIVVSGLFKDVRCMDQELGVHPHAVSLSLGIWGKKALLAPEEILEVTTMCGHGMVSASLVQKLVKEVRTGKRTSKDAAAEVARGCVCGIFNPYRAQILLEQLSQIPV